MAVRPTVLFALDPVHFPMLFPAGLLRRIDAVADASGPVHRLDDPRAAARLADLDILITGWGSGPLDGAVLAAAPRLRAVLHTAGSVKHLIPSEGWARDLIVCSAADANATPVAEYTLGAILLAGKGAFTLRESYRRDGRFTLAEVVPGIGNYRRTVGLVGASRIGRRVAALLAPHDLTVRLHDPYTMLPGLDSVGLDELLATSDVVSLHAPATAETHHLIDRRRLALMRDGAVLINTARGSLVDTGALVDELRTGRISAVLDVTDPEPAPPGSPLHTLPNVFMTPHIAGSHGNELERLGASVVADLERLVAGEPPLHRVHRHELEHAA